MCIVSDGTPTMRAPAGMIPYGDVRNLGVFPFFFESRAAAVGSGALAGTGTGWDGGATGGQPPYYYALLQLTAV